MSENSSARRKSTRAQSLAKDTGNNTAELQRRSFQTSAPESKLVTVVADPENPHILSVLNVNPEALLQQIAQMVNVKNCKKTETANDSNPKPGTKPYPTKKLIEDPAVRSKRTMLKANPENPNLMNMLNMNSEAFLHQIADMVDVNDTTKAETANTTPDVLPRRLIKEPEDQPVLKSKRTQLKDAINYEKRRKSALENATAANVAAIRAGAIQKIADSRSKGEQPSTAQVSAQQAEIRRYVRATSDSSVMNLLQSKRPKPPNVEAKRQPVKRKPDESAQHLGPHSKQLMKPWIIGAEQSQRSVDQRQLQATPQSRLITIPIVKDDNGECRAATKPVDDPAASQVHRMVPGSLSTMTAGVKPSTNPVMGYLKRSTQYPQKPAQKDKAPLLKRLMMDGSAVPSKPVIAHPCDSGTMIAKQKVSLPNSGQTASSNGLKSSYKPAKMPGLITSQSLHNGALEKLHAEMKEKRDLQRAQLEASIATVVKEPVAASNIQGSIQNIIKHNNDESNFHLPIKVIWNGRSVVVPEYVRCECQGLMGLWLKITYVGGTLNTLPTYKCRACCRVCSFALKFSPDQKVADSTWPTVKVASTAMAMKDFDQEAANALPPPQKPKKTEPSWKPVKERTSLAPRKRRAHPSHERGCKDPQHHLSPDVHCGCSAPQMFESIEDERFLAPCPVVAPTQHVTAPAPSVVAPAHSKAIDSIGSEQFVSSRPTEPVATTQAVVVKTEPVEESPAASTVGTADAPTVKPAHYNELNMKQLLQTVFELTGKPIGEQLGLDGLESIPARDFVLRFHKPSNTKQETTHHCAICCNSTTYQTPNNVSGLQRSLRISALQPKGLEADQKIMADPENPDLPNKKPAVRSREAMVKDELDEVAAANLAAIRAGTIQKIVDSRSKGVRATTAQASAQQAEIMKYVQATSDSSVLDLLQLRGAMLPNAGAKRQFIKREVERSAHHQETTHSQVSGIPIVMKNNNGEYRVMTDQVDISATSQVHRMVPGFSSKMTDGHLKRNTPYPQVPAQNDGAPLLKRLLMDGSPAPSKPIIVHPCNSGTCGQAIRNLEQIQAQLNVNNDLRQAQLDATIDTVTENKLQKAIKNLINQNNEQFNSPQAVKVIWSRRSVIVPEFVKCECQGSMSLWLQKSRYRDVANSIPTYKCNKCPNIRPFARKFSSDRKTSESTWPTMRVPSTATMVRDFDEEALSAPPPKKVRQNAPSWEPIRNPTSQNDLYSHQGHVRRCKDPLNHVSTESHCGCLAPETMISTGTERFLTPWPVKPVIGPTQYVTAPAHSEAMYPIGAERFVSPRPTEPAASTQTVAVKTEPVEEPPAASTIGVPYDSSKSVGTADAPKEEVTHYNQLNMKQLFQTVFEMSGRPIGEQLNLDDLESIPAREFVLGFHEYMSQL